MTNESSYPDHVFFTMGDLVSDPVVRGLDVFLGVILALCALVGFPGNIAALRYFVTRKVSCLSTRIYISICITDIFIELLMPPVMVTLFRYREPGIFNNLIFCIFWANVFEFLQRVSNFLAMLLCVTRTISIAAPFYKIHQHYVMAAFFFYCLLIAAEPLIGMLPSVNYAYIYNGNNPNCYQSAKGEVAFMFQYIVEASNILLASLITLISFVITVVSLQGKGPIGNEESRGRSRRATVTVAMFTVIFMLCNLPMSIMVILHYITIKVYGSYPGPIFKNFFFGHYSWVVAKVVFLVLNASLNPVLYLYRMGDFRSWVANRKLKSPITGQVISKTMLYVDSESRQTTPKLTRRTIMSPCIVVRKCPQ